MEIVEVLTRAGDGERELKIGKNSVTVFHGNGIVRIKNPDNFSCGVSQVRIETGKRFDVSFFFSASRARSVNLVPDGKNPSCLAVVYGMRYLAKDGTWKEKKGHIDCPLPEDALRIRAPPGDGEEAK